MKTNNRTFWNGFMRGMAAPMMLFSYCSAPEIRKPSPSPLYRPARSDRESLRRDMQRVGDDMRRAIRTYAAE